MRKFILLFSIFICCQFVFANEIRWRINLNTNWKFQTKILTDAPASVDYADET